MRVIPVGRICIGLTACALCACSRQAESDARSEAPGHPAAAIPDAPQLPVAVAKKKALLPKSRPPTSVTDIDERTDLPPADRKTLKTVEKAMEEEDLKLLLSAMPDATRSATVEVRSETVDALSWFGVCAMDDLLPFMADADADVAQTALDNWTSALGEIEDEKRKCAMIERVMKVLKNKDALETLVIELNGCDDLTALQSVVNLISCGNPMAAEVARDHYEFMTGETFTTLDAANAWAAENCAANEQ